MNKNLVSKLLIAPFLLLTNCAPTARVGNTMDLTRAIEYSMKSIAQASVNLEEEGVPKIGVYPENVVVKFAIKDIDERTTSAGAGAPLSWGAVKVDLSRKATNESSNNIEVTFKSIFKSPDKVMQLSGKKTPTAPPLNLVPGPRIFVHPPILKDR